MLNGFITSQLAILPSLKSYTHTGLLLAIRSVLLVVFSLISISILTRIFDKDTYGLIAYVNSIWGMLSVFNLTGTPTALTNSIAKGLHGTYLFLLRKLVPYSILGVCATAICGFWLHNYDNSEAGTILLLLSPFFLLKPLEYAKPFFTAVGRYNQLLQLELVFSFISFIIVTTLVIYTKSACNYLLSGTILSSLFAIYLFRRSRDYIANNNIHNVSYINSLTFSGINIFFYLQPNLTNF